MNAIDKIREQKEIVRGVIYARFSSDNQREESIDAQIRAIKEYAVTNNVVIVGEYIDKAKSATTDNRPAFLKMISDSKQEIFDVVLVHKLDRFARNRHDSIGYRMELKRHNVSLISILEYFDEDSPESIILESVLEAMSEYYSKNLAREVNKGMRETALKGMHTGGIPPLGYDVDPQTKKLIINHKESEAVKLIFKLFIEGNGYKSIAKKLNSHNYKTKNDSEFSHSSVSSVLKNEKYSGVYIFNKSSSKDIDGKRNGSIHKAAKDIIRIDGAVPAIISKEEFKIVKEKINTNKRPGQPYKAKEVYLLSGKIFCNECGSNFVGNSHYSGRNKNLHITYRCTGRSSKRTCSNKEIRREYIETFVLDMLSNYIFNDKLIPKLIKAYSKYKYLKNSELLDEEKKIKKRLISIKKEIDNLLILASKIAGSESLAKKLTDLESEKVILETKSTKLSTENELNTVTEKDLIYSFNQAKSLLAYGKLPMTKKLIELYIECVNVGLDDVKVYFKAHPDLVVPEIEKVKLPNGEKVYKRALELSKKKLQTLKLTRSQRI